MIPIAKPLIGEEEKKAVAEVLDSGMIACGPRTAEFEKQFATFIGTNHAISTTSGTTALHLALATLGIAYGDEVIVPSFSFIATVNPVLFCNATPVFCDVDPRTFNIDVEKLKNLLSEKTKAVIPVHLYGQPADMNPIIEIAEDKGIHIIGDAAQAHGAEYNGKKIGTFGNMECFSLYPTKNMTSGEGGMVTTNSDDLADRLISLRNHGREKTNWGYEHGKLGYNYRMTDVAAAIGLEQLKKLPMFNKKRRENALYFNEHLKDNVGIEIPYVIDNVKHVYHQYTIKCEDRDSVVQKFRKNEIGCGIYYPEPLHFFNHLKQFGHSDLKNSETVADQVLSIPVHPSLAEIDLEKIVGCF